MLVEYTPIHTLTPQELMRLKAHVARLGVPPQGPFIFEGKSINPVEVRVLQDSVNSERRCAGSSLLQG